MKEKEHSKIEKKKKADASKTVNMEATTELESDKPKMKVAKPKRNKGALEKGWRKMPVPCDDQGCQHMGITELKELPKAYLKSYVKEGKWLANKPCKDCAARPEIEGDRVMDVADILTRNGEPNGDMARYCNYGPNAHSMEDDDEFKVRFTCDMILCKACYRKRNNRYEEMEAATGRRRSSRNRRMA